MSAGTVVPGSPDEPQPPPLRPLVAIPIHGLADPAIAALRAAVSRAATVPAPTFPDPAPADPAAGLATASQREPSKLPPADNGPEATGGHGEAAAPPPDPGEPDPCAAARRLAEQRCTLAEEARAEAERARRALADVRRAYDEELAAAERAATAADPRTIQAAKEAARVAFREARAAAREPAQLEAAARAWLTEINRINAHARLAASELQRARAAAAELASQVETLALRADAARIAAETAAEACLAARAALAECEEVAGRRAGAPGPVPAAPGATTGSGEARGARSVTELPPLSGDPLVLRLVRGDPRALETAAGRLAGDDPAAWEAWSSTLTAFVAAVRERAVEESVLVFPPDHPFWGLFTPQECREIAAALGALGFRFDGDGGWVNDRRPSQRDLSLAVGYAGMDPMRIRRWPRDEEIANLFREVAVAADELLAERAGGLTLGELITLLGPRADGLAELWNAWGRVRPIFLAPA